MVTIGSYLDGDNPGEYTRAAIEAFEPHVLWEHKFLELRRACYTATHSPRAKQASRDLDEFMKNEGSTADVSALTKEIETRSGKSDAKANSSQAQELDLRP
jgi:hypothetical protein